MFTAHKAIEDLSLTIIDNPVLPGFHPDPSICRAGDTYYIATSTFHWFPGVRIHRSKDLVNWELCGSALTRESQLPLRGVPDHGGIWAPCLSYTPPTNTEPGRFWLIYTIVRARGNNMGDFPNFLVTADDPAGDWSEPIFLNASGFDPSMFHDEDGRHWLTNMVWDHRDGRHAFSGIALQEYDHNGKRMVGPSKIVFKGTDLGITEAPHIYRHEGRYYLMTAEGGTFYDHAVTMARANTVWGPYELDPQNPMLTSAGDASLKIQKAGHASLVETPEGELILAHLGGRPVGKDRRCILGRETSLQRCVWSDDGWLRLRDGGNAPAATAEVPSDAEFEPVDRGHRDEFNGSALDPSFQSPRVPMDESWISLSARHGFCRLVGRDSLASRFDQSLIARRVQAFHCRAETSVEFEPTHFQQMAGLIAYYDTTHWIYAHVTADDDGNRVVRLGQADAGEYSDSFTDDVKVPDGSSVQFRCEFDHETLRFWVRFGETGDWQRLGPDLDATILSDDYGGGHNKFTGAFVGICCQDMTGQRAHADFDWFEYAEL